MSLVQGMFLELPATATAEAKDYDLYDLGVREPDLINVWYLHVLYIQDHLHLLHIIKDMVITQFYFLLCHTELKYTTYCRFFVSKFCLVVFHYCAEYPVDFS